MRDSNYSPEIIEKTVTAMSAPFIGLTSDMNKERKQLEQQQIDYLIQQQASQTERQGEKLEQLVKQVEGQNEAIKEQKIKVRQQEKKVKSQKIKKL